MSILSRFSRRASKRVAAPPFQGFGTFEDFEAKMRSSTYVVFTAQNPKVHTQEGPWAGETSFEPESPESSRNRDAIRYLMQQLDQHSIYYTPVIGAYEGAEEYSVIAWNHPEYPQERFIGEIQDMANELGQAEVVTGRADSDVALVITTNVVKKDDVEKPASVGEPTGVLEGIDPNPQGYISKVPLQSEQHTGETEEEFRGQVPYGQPYPADVEDQTWALSYQYAMSEVKDFDSLKPNQKAAIEAAMLKVEDGQ